MSQPVLGNNSFTGVRNIGIFDSINSNSVTVDNLLVASQTSDPAGSNGGTGIAGVTGQLIFVVNSALWICTSGGPAGVAVWKYVATW